MNQCHSLVASRTRMKQYETVVWIWACHPARGRMKCFGLIFGSLNTADHEPSVPGFRPPPPLNTALTHSHEWAPPPQSVCAADTEHRLRYILILQRDHRLRTERTNCSDQKPAHETNKAERWEKTCTQVITGSFYRFVVELSAEN